MSANEPAAEIPKVVLSNPALLFLYYRVEQILGIRATGEALVKLNEHIEKHCGYPFVENPEAYENMLTSREQIFEISEIVTINETYFFREGAHFDLLARHFLPKLVKQNRPIKICSAATSIGCEAYSLAMLLDYHAKNRYAAPFDFEIDAFDVCAGAIETAKNARYTANALRIDGSAWKYIMDLYLIPDGAEYIVSQDIREKVRFSTHNIMRGLNKQYDVIFFRNALIYFSSKNRFIVLNDLAESLFNNGLLFLGISETPSVKHPLLVSQYMSDVFYFQKTMADSQPQRPLPIVAAAPRPVELRPAEPKPATSTPRIAARPNPEELPIHCGEVAAIMETDEGKPNAMKTLEAVADTPADTKNTASVSGSELAASVTFFLGAQDYGNACLVLSYLEKRNRGPLPSFLRGEYHMQRGNTGEARQCFEQAAGKEKAFWPAFYRLVSCVAGENQDRAEYKIRKACESIEMGRDLRYECFLGGFSPDYFRRILERKLP